MNILIIDDEETVCRSLERYVEFRGDRPYTATDGRHGLQVFAAEAIDLIITDINMPDIDGLEVLRSVHRDRPDVPVIIVTAYANTDMAINAINEGAFAFLQKPFLTRDLNEKINDAFNTLSARQQADAQLEDLGRSVHIHRQRLEREQAFSAAVLRHSPFPVCLVDIDGDIHMTNPPFRRAIGSGMHLTEVLPHLDRDALSRMPSGLHVKAGDSTFRVKGFAIHTDDAENLTCLFFQDITLELKSQFERQLRQWSLEQAYQFRDDTADLIYRDDPGPHLAQLIDAILQHLNPVTVRLTIGTQTSSSGTSAYAPEPYLALPIPGSNGDLGRLELFSPQPTHVDIQSELATKLVELVGQRLQARTLQLRLIQNNQLRALGEMAAGVAHELNQPLSGIRVFAEGLIYGLHHDWDTTPETLEETLGEIVSQVDRMSDIIEHMRNFSRPQDDSAPVTFAIKPFVDAVLKLVRAQLTAHNITLQLDIPAELPSCTGRPRLLQQVLLNLINNARQAMDARALDPPEGWSPCLCLQARADDEARALRLAVIDNGGGVPTDIADRIFEPFFTTKEGGKGNGLGLPISHYILHQQDCRLEFDNHTGKGATFTLIIPTLAAPEQP